MLKVYFNPKNEKDFSLKQVDLFILIYDKNNLYVL